LIGLVFYQRQNIFDWWKLQSYETPASISALANEVTMTDYAEKVFYVNQPAVTPKANFSEFCPKNGGERTIVLGCYHPKQNGIYLLQVTDKRLNGVEQVTAAHEMLHAAYDRLSSDERERVDAMLMDYYDNGLNDKRISDTIDSYKQSEPNDVVNEMHSIFGTEIDVLPVELEVYYRQYFEKRSAVVAFAVDYQDEFTSRQKIVEAADAQLSIMKAQIDELNADLKTKQSEISSAQANLNELRATDVAAYNAAVPAYNRLIDAYNSEIQQLRNLITRYNELVNSRNATAGEADELTRELSSDVAPINR
jgi:flagellar biosynthesis chaperone FliJ